MPVQCLEGHNSCWIHVLSLCWSSLLRISLSNSTLSSRPDLLFPFLLEHKSSHSSQKPAWYSSGTAGSGGPCPDPGAMCLVSASQLSNALNCTGSKSKKIRPSRSFGRTLSQRPLNNWDKQEPSIAVKVSRLVMKLVSPPTFNLMIADASTSSPGATVSWSALERANFTCSFWMSSKRLRLPSTFSRDCAKNSPTASRNLCSCSTGGGYAFRHRKDLTIIQSGASKDAKAKRCHTWAKTDAKGAYCNLTTKRFWMLLRLLLTHSDVELVFSSRSSPSITQAFAS